MDNGFRHTSLWDRAREQTLARDADRCTVSRLLGGPCSDGPLHVHHIVPVEDGGALYDLDNLGTTCSVHHPIWEALRRQLVRSLLGLEQSRRSARCPHHHTSRHAREVCERRRARQLAEAA